MKRLFIISLSIIGAILLSAPGYAVQPQHIILYLPFDGGEGDTVKDVSGGNLKGTFVGDPTWVDGKFGAALEFDGTDDYVEIERDARIEPSKEISLAVWVKLNTNTGNYEVARKQLPNGNGYDMRIQSGSLHWWVRIGAWTNANYPKQLDTDKWIFLTGTYDGEEINIYVDGEKVATNKGGGDVSYDAGNLGIGSGRPHDPNYNFDGIIDDFKLWNVALSDSEVKSAMAETGASAVTKSHKLPITWANIKLR